MKCSRECAIIFSRNHETAKIQVLERGGRILVLEKAGLICLVQSIIRIQRKKMQLLGTLFVYNHINYIKHIIHSNHVRFISAMSAISVSVFASLAAIVPPQQWFSRRRSVVVTLPRPRQALTFWRTRNQWWGVDGFVFGFRCRDWLLDDVGIDCWMILGLFVGQCWMILLLLCWTTLDYVGLFLLDYVGLCVGNVRNIFVHCNLKTAFA